MNGRLSLSVRAALVAAVPIALVMAVASVLHATAAASDNVLAAERQVEGAIRQVTDRYLAGTDLVDAPLDPAVAEVVIVERGGVIVTSAGPRDEVPASLPVGVLTAAEAPGGGRFVWFKSVPEPPDDVVIVLAEPAPGPRGVLRSNGWRYVAVSLLGVAIVAAAVGFAVKRALRRVEDLRGQVDEIDLGRTVPHVGVPAGSDELSRLATTLNVMVDRIRQSAAKLEGFAADTAHELRNPLAAVRSNLEVVQSSGDPGTRRVSADRAMHELDRCSRLVDSLLLVAMLERGEPTTSPEPAEALGVIMAAVADIEDRHPSLSVDTVAIEPAVVGIDASHLAMVVGNVLDNGARYARSALKIALQADGRSALITIADDGPGLPPDSREAVFERFRTGAGAHHFGLGLPLARRLVERTGGSLRAVDPGPLGGACFEIRIPQSTPGAVTASVPETVTGSH